MGTIPQSSLTYKQRFIKNLSLLYLATLISKVFALAINIILVRKLGASVYGDYGFALTFVTYFTLLADSGLSAYGEAVIAKSGGLSGDLKEGGVTKIAGDIFSFNLFLSIISGVILVISAVYILRFGKVQTDMLILVSAAPLAYVFGFNYVIKALEINQITALSVFLGRLVYFAGIILFVAKKSDYLYSILFFIIGTLITSLTQFGYVMRLIGRLRLNFSLKNFKLLAVNGMPFGIVSALLIFYAGLPVLFLKILTGNKNVGYFYMAGRLVFFVSSFVGLIMGAFIPILSEAVKNRDLKRQSSIMAELLRFNYTFLIPVCVGGVALSGRIISVFFGQGYLTSAGVLDIMIWSILFIGISAVFNGYLTVLQDRKKLVAGAAAASVAGILTTPVLIKLYGVYGGAAASVFMEFVTAFTLIIFVLKAGGRRNTVGGGGFSGGGRTGDNVGPAGKEAGRYEYNGKTEGNLKRESESKPDGRLSIKVDWLNFIKVLAVSATMGIIVGVLNAVMNFKPVIDLSVSIAAGIFIYFALSAVLGTLKKEDLTELRGMRGMLKR